MTFLLKQRIKRLVYPFKYGFWTICRINKFRLEMLWEDWDSYAGDGDYGYMFSYTGNRKTTKQMRREYSDCIFNPFGEDGFVFCLPFFVSYILLFIPTLIYDYQCRKSIEREIEFYKTHVWDDKNNTWGEKK